MRRLSLLALALCLLTSSTSEARLWLRRPSGGPADCLPPTCIAVSPPATNLNAILQANPTGTTFVLAAGTYRPGQIAPKQGQTILGTVTTILSGGTVLGTWTGSGPWTATGVATSGGSTSATCDGAFPLCGQPEDLYIDGVQQTLVASAGAVTVGTAKWFFSRGTGVVTIGTNPAGHTIEIGNGNKAIVSSANNVTIKNVVIQYYGPGAQNAAVEPSGNDWLFDNVEVRWVHGTGVLLLGDRGTWQRGSVHHIGQLGIGAHGSDNTYDGLTPNGFELAFNNTAGYSPGWEAGGSKFATSTRLTVRYANVHDNFGPGLWTDIDNVNTLYELNNVHDNDRAGIFVEISYDTIIRNNTVTNNGTGAISWIGNPGILVAESKNVEIYGNTLNGNQAGIMAMQQFRQPGPLGTHEVVNMYVHDNDVTQSGNFAAGLVCDMGLVTDPQPNCYNPTGFWPVPPASGASIRWVHNNYHTSGGAQWAWNNGGRTFSYWQGTGQQDTTGTGP